MGSNASAYKRWERHHVEFRVNCDLIDPASGRPLAVTIASIRRDGAFQGLLNLTAHSAAGRRLLSSLEPEQRVDFVLRGNAYAARVASVRNVSLHAIDVAQWIFRPVTLADGGKFPPRDLPTAALPLQSSARGDV